MKIFLITLLATFGSMSQAETLNCVNFYNHNGVERIVDFTAQVYINEQLPDSLFIIYPETAGISVLEQSGDDGDEYEEVFVSDTFERIYADEGYEVLTSVGSIGAGDQPFWYHLSFDRTQATMNIKYYAEGEDYNSSVDSSVCRFVD